MKKQTAIDYLVEQLFPKALSEEQYYHITQAKAMEKEQRIQDMSKMQIISDVDFDGNVTFMFSPEQYYNETYGGDK
jgi:hypothetical protein